MWGTDNSREGCWVRLETEAGLSEDSGVQDNCALQRHLSVLRGRGKLAFLQDLSCPTCWWSHLHLNRRSWWSPAHCS